MKRFFISLGITLIIGGITLILINHFQTRDLDEELGFAFDMSFATNVNINELSDLIKGEETILMIGNKSENSTAKMSSFLKDVANDYKLKIYYLEKDGLNKEAYDRWVISIPTLSKYSGFSPVLLVFKNNTLISGYPGDAQYRNLYSFLKFCEVKGVV